MSNRTDLQALFEEILESPNVYFQPPENKRIEYDCIIYSVSNRDIRHANNNPYKHDVAYQVIVIYKNPDSDLPKKISSLPTCRFDRSYKKDNLNHEVFTLYW